MSVNKQSLHTRLYAMDAKLDETLTGLDRGPVKDAMRLVVPMMHDQILALHEIVEGLPD